MLILIVSRSVEQWKRRRTRDESRAEVGRKVEDVVQMNKGAALPKLESGSIPLAVVEGEGEGSGQYIRIGEGV